MKISFNRFVQNLKKYDYSINKFYFVNEFCKFLELKSPSGKVFYIDMKTYQMQVPPEYKNIFYLKLKDIEENKKNYVSSLNIEKNIIILNDKNILYCDKDEIFCYDLTNEKDKSDKEEDEVNNIENEFNKMKESILVDKSEEFIEIKGKNKVIFKDEEGNEIKEGSEFEKLIIESTEPPKINIDDEKIVILSNKEKEEPLEFKENVLIEEKLNYIIGNFFMSTYINDFYEMIETFDENLLRDNEYLESKEQEYLNNLFEKFDYLINEHNTNILYKFKNIEEENKKLKVNREKLSKMLKSCNSFSKVSERKEIEIMNTKIKNSMNEINLNLLKNRDDMYTLLDKYSQFEQILKTLNI